MELAIIVTIVITLALLTLRLYITNKHFDRANAYIFSQRNHIALAQEYLNVDKMFSDAISLTKWRYRDMFPGLEEK